MLTIGLTGGIGSGKSTVAKMFKDLQVPVFDTDVIARELVEPGQPALDEIKNTFGSAYYNKPNILNRKKLATLVFSDFSAKQKLESILHPRIKKLLINLIKKCTAPYCIAVIPLLLESHWEELVDRILVVDTLEEHQINRATRRNDTPEELVKSIIKSQIDRKKRLSAADDIIENNSTLDELQHKVLVLHKKYILLSKHVGKKLV